MSDIATVCEIVLGAFQLIGTGCYLHAFFRFHALVAIERPGWIDRHSSMRALYDGLPRASEPNVAVALIGLAFSARRDQLSAEVRRYAQRIRILLPLLLGTFCLILLLVLSGTR